MEVTEVRIKLIEEAGERLQAFCSITFDNCFVIRDLKIIGGQNGPFVAMPSRKLTAHCPQCGCKNHLRAGYCNQCGNRLKEDRTVKDEDGRLKLYADIAHPINSACREMIQERVIREFREEIVRSKQPGYVSRYEDFDSEDYVPPARRRDPAQSHPVAARNGQAREPVKEPASFARPAIDSNNRVQSPEPQQPPPPHSMPTIAATTAAGNGMSAATPQSTDGFGAGIF